MKILNKESFEIDVIQNKNVILIDFFATWCPPCKMLSPILEKISESRSGYEIAKVNIDENQELAIKYGVEVVPTMIVFKNGEPKEKIVGYCEEEEIVQKMSKYI